MIPIDIITCPQWKARQPTHPIKTVGAPVRILIHHTAGHHPEVGDPTNESRDEAIRYAQNIQTFHMDHNG